MARPTTTLKTIAKPKYDALERRYAGTAGNAVLDEPRDKNVR